MPPQWALQGPLQEIEIEVLQQEIIRLKRRLSRLERRKDVSPFSRDFDGIRPRDDQISSIYEDVFERPPLLFSTPPSIESNFEEFEDSLPNSSFLPLYDEPVYDVYDDDLFGEVLDLEQPIDDEDEKSKSIQEVIVEKKNGGVERSVGCSANVDTLISVVESVHDGWGAIELKEGDHVLPIFTEECKENVLCIGLILIGLDAAGGARIGVQSKGISSDYATFKKLKIDRQIDTGWTYPNWFSQPNPPPYGGQTDICLSA